MVDSTLAKIPNSRMMQTMLTDYIQRALDKARYEMIDDEEPFYLGWRGFWATGRTLEGCRQELARAVEDWILFSVAKGLSIPPMDGITVQAPHLLAD